MNRCNHCTLEDFKKTAAASGGTLLTRRSPYAHGLYPEAVDVFIHYPNDPEPTWCAWLMKVPDRCAC